MGLKKLIRTVKYDTLQQGFRLGFWETTLIE